jgi:tetratricopeptide (TPR) repeat protein
MKSLFRLLLVLVCAELIAALVLLGLRLNSCRPSPPDVERYTDTVTGAELVALPDRFLFDSPRKWRTLGETYLKAGFLHKAEASLRRAAESDPGSAEIAVIHGYCLERLGLLDEAHDAYRRAAGLARGGIRETAWYLAGRVCLQREDAKGAVEAFEQAGEDHLPSVYQLARMQVREGRALDAVPLLKRLVEDEPRELRVLQLQAQVAEARGEVSAAADARDAAEWSRPSLPLHKLPPGLLTIDGELGMSRQFQQAAQQQQTGNTAAAAERMLPLTEDQTRWYQSSISLLESVAAAQLAAGNLAAARTLLERQLAPDGFPTARAWNLKGRLEFLEQNDDQARDAFFRCELMHPPSVDYELLGRLAERQGDADAARHDFGLANQYAGIDALRDGNLDGSLLLLQQATKADPRLASAWFYRGEAERLLNNRRAAEVAYQRCLALNPRHGRALAQLERLARPVAPRAP